MNIAIKRQEEKDYNIMAKVYSAICTNCKVINKKCDDYCYWDMETSAITDDKCLCFATEIKNLTKEVKEFIVKDYKILNLLNKYDGNAILAYIMCNKVYLFNLKTIDWNTTKTRFDRWWKCEFDHSRGQEYQFHRILPISLAYKIIDLCQL